MWSKQLARISSCLSPSHSMYLWSSSVFKKEVTALSSCFMWAGILSCKTLLPPRVFPEQTNYKVLGPWSTENRGIGVERQGNKHPQKRAKIISKWRTKVCSPCQIPILSQAWCQRHLSADDSIGLRGLEGLGVRAAACMEAYLPPGATPLRQGLRTIELCAWQMFGQKRSSICFLFLGAVEAQGVRWPDFPEAGASASQATSNLAKVMQRVSDAVRDGWKSLCGCFSLMLPAHLH